MSVKYGVRLAPKPARQPPSISFFLVMIYTVAVGITPEFQFLGVPKVRYTDLLLPLIMVTPYLSSTIGRSQKKKSFPLQNLFLVILSWNLGCLLLWGSASLTPGLFYLAKRFEFFLIAYFVSRSITDLHSWNKAVRTMVFASPLLSLTVLHEMRTNLDSSSILSSGEYLRASGIIANQQSSTALYIAVATCITLCSLRSFKDPLWKLACMVSLAVGFAAVLATGSRGGLAALIVSLLATIIQKPRQALPLATLCLVFGLGAWSFTPVDLQKRFLSLLPETQVTLEDWASYDGENNHFRPLGSSSVYDRWVVATYALQELIPQSGLTGLGAGYKVLGSIDNFYLMEWISHGLIGLVLWLSFQASITVGCWRLSRSSMDEVESGFSAGATSAMLVMGVSGFQGDSFFLIRPAEELALVLGMVLARRELRS